MAHFEGGTSASCVDRDGAAIAPGQRVSFSRARCCDASAHHKDKDLANLKCALSPVWESALRTKSKSSPMHIRRHGRWRRTPPHSSTKDHRRAVTLQGVCIACQPTKLRLQIINNDACVAKNARERTLNVNMCRDAFSATRFMMRICTDASSD